MRYIYILYVTNLQGLVTTAVFFTSHATGPGSIRGRVNLLVEGFSGVFPQPWDFRILGKNPDGTDNPVVNFGEVQRAQLAKSNILISSLVPLGSRSFKDCSDAKERVGCKKQRKATAPIHP